VAEPLPSHPLHLGDRDRRAATKARIDVPHLPVIHDMAFTQSFIQAPT
jgi:carotenoid cleavage dioxygenase